MSNLMMNLLPFVFLFNIVTSILIETKFRYAETIAWIVSLALYGMIRVQSKTVKLLSEAIELQNRMDEYDNNRSSKT